MEESKEKQDLTDKVSKMMERFGDMPVINTRIYKSKDNKYIINEIRIKTIKPAAYYEAIIKGKKNDFYPGDEYYETPKEVSYDDAGN